MRLKIILILTIILLIGGCTMSEKTVLLKTNKGDIKIKLHEDMPITAGNFEKISKRRILQWSNVS